MEHLRKSQELLTCPHCDRPVRLDNGSLIRVNEVPASNQLEAAQLEYETLGAHLISIQNYIQALQNAHQDARRSYEAALKAEQIRVDELKARHQTFALEYQRATMARAAHESQVHNLESALQRLMAEVGDFSDPAGPLLNPAELQQHYNLIASLRTIKIIAPPLYSSTQIEAYRQFEQAAFKRSELQATMYVIPPAYRNESTMVLRQALTLVDEYERQTQIFRMEEAKHNHLLESYQSQIETITRELEADPALEIETTRAQIEALTQKLTLSERAHRALSWHAQITLERNELVELDTMVADLQVLRQYILKTECIILQQVVDTINAIIEDVCGTLFDRDINITLRLDKLLKSTKHIKQEVNFIIEYQGGTYEALSQLSGGEEDRASLALTLALNRLSACPILMLDELLGSLDTNTKDAAIRTIREQTNHTVLVIMHGGVEGIFDAVIDCEELR
jgi:DNA repair exonuclease SbcCD ATPase subunit